MMGRRRTRITDQVSLTASGVYITPLALKPEQVRIIDIAHHLSNLCRFVGGTRPFYGVAEHSVRVSLQLHGTTQEEVELSMWGLLHDAPEYALGDLPAPVKHSEVGKLYREAEARAMAAVAEAFNLTPLDSKVDKHGMPAAVKEVDNRMLLTERRDLLPNGVEDPWVAGDLEPYRQRIRNPWTPEHAEWEFMRRYRYLERQRVTLAEAA